ncbi:MAG: glycosyltransferase family 2 protein [Burkholderiales bacterium]|nr:glycosyltransferase family 2 protein [Burkholderiales bacterium]
MSSIDIVVPCYRYGRYLRGCVLSALNQGVEHIRVLILDDASPDETPEVATALAREDSRVTYRRHAVNQGHISTFNEGIDWTSADYMLLLSADDYLLPGALQRAIDHMDAHPDVGMCFGQALAMHGDGTLHQIELEAVSSGEPSAVVSGAEFVRMCARAGTNNIVPTPSAVIRTNLLKRLGGYRPDLPHAGDMEMWLRVAAHAPIGILYTNQAVYRRHGANMSSAYLQDHSLSDLQQRKVAIDAFRDICRTSAPEMLRVYQSLLPPMALDAVGHASSAFNANRMELCQRLCDFATSAHPGVRRSPAWLALACKKLMGHRMSTALLPTVTRIREARTWIHG